MQMPSVNQQFEANCAEVTTFVLRMIEKLVSYQPQPKVLERLVALRSKYETEVANNDEKKKEQEEKLRLEKEKKLATMDPARRKKLEEQRQKSKAMKKFKVK